jgi:hypothetical protein
VSSLIKIAENTVSSPTASISLTGIDSTYDVYVVMISNAKVDTDDALAMRVTKSGTAQTDSNYDDAKIYLKSDTSIANIANENTTQIDITATIDSGDSASNGNGVYYLFNFPNADEYSFVTIDSSHYQYNDNSGRGFAGSFLHTVASASDGVLIKTNGGNNITAGNFLLFGIRK